MTVMSSVMNLKRPRALILIDKKILEGIKGTHGLMLQMQVYILSNNRGGFFISYLVIIYILLEIFTDCLLEYLDLLQLYEATIIMYVF